MVEGRAGLGSPAHATARSAARNEPDRPGLVFSLAHLDHRTQAVSRILRDIQGILPVVVRQQQAAGLQIGFTGFCHTTGEERQEQIRAFGVKRYGLFGSFVRGEHTDESDVDILVEFEPGQKTFDHFMHLAFFLEELLGRPVDLVTLESLSPYIGPHILQEVEYAASST